MALLCVGSEGGNQMNIKKGIPKMVAEPLRAIFARITVVHASGADAAVTTVPMEPVKDDYEPDCLRPVRPYHVSWTAIQDCKEKTLLRFISYPHSF
jgi:hypothetical protein